MSRGATAAWSDDGTLPRGVAGQAAACHGEVLWTAGGTRWEGERKWIDDAVLFVARFDSGALGSFEATRFASGRKNAARLEINGSKGSIAFDLEAMNELQFHDHTEDPDTAGFRRILVTEPTHPYADAWWPPGHGLGYGHTFTHEVVDLVRAIGGGHAPVPSFADGLQVQQVLAAVERSAEHGSGWENVVQQGVLR